MGSSEAQLSSVFIASLLTTGLCQMPDLSLSCHGAPVPSLPCGADGYESSPGGGARAPSRCQPVPLTTTLTAGPSSPRRAPCHALLTSTRAAGLLRVWDTLGGHALCLRTQTSSSSSPRPHQSPVRLDRT